MGQARRRIQRHRDAKSEIARLIAQPEQVVVIHYSCESFYDTYNSATPRVTSIAVRNLGSGQTTSFSIHQMAEIKGYSQEETSAHYDDLEKLMLREFYKYVNAHTTHTWLHWNMRDMNFGFQAIAHRYKILKGHPIEVQDSNLINLSQLLIGVYGPNYVQHPRLEQLVKKNNFRHRDFLTGEEEGLAFQNSEYVRLHQSTLRKVEVLSNILKAAENGKLTTDSRWSDIYGLYPEAWGSS
jgi:hypothetical protein